MSARFLTILLLILLLSAFACACGGSSDSSSDDDAGNPSDDTDDDLDDMHSDDTGDDEDDTDDDDDSGDDTQDDTDDDDIQIIEEPNDVTDNPGEFPPREPYTIEGVTFQELLGGSPGYRAISLAFDENGLPAIATDYGRSLFVYHQDAEGAWTRERVAVYTGQSRMVSDSAGKLHIVYYCTGDQRLHYLTNVSGAWVDVWQNASDEKPSGADIAVDASGFIHISYIFDEIGLRYVTNTSGSWVTVENLNGCFLVKNTNIRVAANQTVHISAEGIADSMVSTLYYWNVSSGVAWQLGIGCDQTLAVDAQGHVYIFYHYDYALRNLLYRTNADGLWNVHVLADADASWSYSLGSFNAFFDGDGFLHVMASYEGTDDSESSIYYATNKSGSWTARRSPAGGPYDHWNVSALMNPSGKIQISYSDYAGNFWHGIRNTDDPGWETEKVEYGNSIIAVETAKDSDSNISIIYHKPRLKNVYYGSIQDGVFTEELIDTDINTASFSRLSLDSSDHAHALYMKYSESEKSEFSMVYTTNFSGSWTKEIIETGNIGGGQALAIEPDGTVHAFYKGITSDITHAVKVSGVWQTEYITTSGGGEVEPVTDSEGHVYAAINGQSGLYFSTNVSGTWETNFIDVEGAGNFAIGIENEEIIHVLYADDTFNFMRHLVWFDETDWDIYQVEGSYKPLGMESSPDGTLGVVHYAQLDGGYFSTGTDEPLTTTLVDPVKDVYESIYYKGFFYTDDTGNHTAVFGTEDYLMKVSF